ncbi:MAG: YchJ family metal-binding protein [Desulfurivibrionaceae bacterium]
MSNKEKDGFCPCGTGLKFAECCGPFLEGSQLAPTAEALMRSRYTAFAVQNVPYLLRSWHRRTRPATLDLDDQAGFAWHGIEVLETEGGGQGEQAGVVEFIANFSGHGQEHRLHERAQFVCEEGQWLYVDGKVNPGRVPATSEKIGRNEPCPCGSGKKYKKCCQPK